MKILFSLTYYHPYISGLSGYVKRLAEGLARSGKYRISVVCIKHKPGLNDFDEVDNVLINRIKGSIRLNKWIMSLQWVVWILVNVKNYDVVILNLPEPEGPILALAGIVFRKKIISIYHCSPSLSNNAMERVFENLVKLSSRICLRLSHKIVVNSHDYVNSIDFPHHDKDKICEVYPLVTDIPQSHSATRRPKDNIIYMGVVGRLSKEKGIGLVLEMLERNLLKENVRLKIAGPVHVPGENKYATRIFERAEKIGNKVQILGQLDETELISFYKSIDVLVFPSTNSTESFGMVQVEAMLSGTPVVASDIPGVRVPIMVTGMGELFQSGNVEQLADSVNKVTSNRGSYIKRQGKVREIFSNKRSISQWEDILKDL